MDNFLCLLCSLSISGGVLVLFVALLNRLLRRKIPRSFLCGLWLLVLARLLLPVGAGWSLTNRLLSAFQETRTQAAPSAGMPTLSGEANPLVGPDGGYVPAILEQDRTPVPVCGEPSAPSLPSAASVLTAVWGLGVLVFLSWRLYSYHRLNRSLIEGEMPAADWELELYSGLIGERGAGPALRRSEAIRSPLLAGVLRPVIWLPADSLDAVELSYALRHELTHWRRHDLACKWAAALTACLHWFNPAVWYLLRALNRDCELSCDEAVVRELPPQDRCIYGELLLRCAAGKAPTGAPCASLKTQKQVMRERLAVIMKKNPDSQKTRALFAAAAAAVILMGAVLGAYASGDTEKGDNAVDDPVLVPLEIDLNRNGVPETINVVWQEDRMRYQLTVTEGDKVIFTQNAYTAHVGWIALFLYQKDGQDYLLRYTPMMWQGHADYGYRLFYLAEDGPKGDLEVIVQEDWIRFDIDFVSSAHGDFGPETVAAFLTEINALLAGSTQLMNTDNDLLEAFASEGRLYHVPFFLRREENFSYDKGKTMLENLVAYKSAMEDIYS